MTSFRLCVAGRGGKMLEFDVRVPILLTAPFPCVVTCVAKVMLLDNMDVPSSIANGILRCIRCSKVVPQILSGQVLHKIRLPHAADLHFHRAQAQGAPLDFPSLT